MLTIEQKSAELPGVVLASSLVRQYPHGEDTAHIVGYASSITAEELDNDTAALSTDITGKTGLERFYNDSLHGVHGVAYQEIDASGRVQKRLDVQEPEAGAALHTTLDLDLQQYIMQELRDWRIEETDEPLTGASVVAIDPRSGAIRALASHPSYDANSFSQPRLAKQAQSVVTAENQPLFNRAIRGSYPPGSTIKPFFAVAALAEGIVDASTSIPSTGGISIGPWHFPDWKAGGHGPSNVGKAIAESVNTFFYTIVGGTEQQSGLGVTEAAHYLQRFHWGQPTGIDLPEEGAGFIPSPDWKEEVKNEPWYIGDTYHLAIGQGDVLATPLQLAASTSAIANNGTFFEPYLVETEEGPAGDTKTKEPVPHRIDIDPTHITTVRQSMRETVIGPTGSGRRLAPLVIPLAGKTGTAQVGGTDETHAWFTSFGPYEEPELAIVVLLERGGAGDKAAVPFAEKVWQWWIKNRS